MIVNQGHDTYKNDLQSWMETLEATHAGFVNDLTQVQLAQRTMYLFEAERLANRLAADHPRLTEIQARLAAKAELIDHLAVEQEIAGIKVARATKDDTLIHGRVVDEDKQGMAGVTVSLVNAKGEPMAQVPPVQTDAAGYYAFVLTPEQGTTVASEGALSVALGSDQERVVPAAVQSFTVQAGEKSLHEVALSHAEIGRLEARTRVGDSTIGVKTEATRKGPKAGGKTDKKT